MTDVTLYDYWRSSAAYRLRIAFNLAGIPYRAVPVDLVKGEHLGAANAARNPQRLVPTVEIDGQVMTQSLAVIEYLHEAGHHEFLPQDALGRQKVRALSYAIAMEIHPVCNLSVARFATEVADELTMQAWMQQFIPKGLTGFEAMLTGDGDYCYGDSVTMADLCLAPQIYNASRWEVDLAPFPRTMAVYEKLARLEPFAAAHPDRHKPV